MLQARIDVQHWSALQIQLCQAATGQNVPPHLHLRCAAPGQELSLAAPTFCRKGSALPCQGRTNAVLT